MATYEECLAVVREALQPQTESRQAPGEQDSLAHDLGLSSLQMLELVVDLEERFDISLPLNDLPDVRTVDELARLLQAALEDRG